MSRSHAVQPDPARRRALAALLAATAAAVLLALAGTGLWSHLTQGGFDVRGSASQRADRTAASLGAGSPDLVLLATAATAAATVDTPQAASAGRALTDRLRHEPGVSTVHAYWDRPRDPALRSQDGRTAMIAVTLDADSGSSAAARRSARLAARYAGDRRWQGALRITATGPAFSNAEATALSRHDLLRAEALAAPFVAAVLIAAFGSVVLTLVPVAVAALSGGATLAALNLLAGAMPMSVFALNLASALGTGFAVDYALFLITRYREQRLAGDPPPQALAVTRRTAGRTVWFSALTVAAALSVLFVFPFDFLRSMAAAGIAVTLLSAASAQLVVPAALTLVGDRALPKRERAALSPTWHRLAVAVTRRPVAIGGACCLALAALVLPSAHLRFGLADERVLPPTAQAHIAAERIRTGFRLQPDRQLQAVLPDLDPRRHHRALAAYAHRLDRLPDVTGVTTAGNAHGTVLTISTAVPPDSPAAGTLVHRITALPVPAAGQLTGPAVRFREDTAALTGRLPFAALLLSAVTALLLGAFTRSLLVPLKAVAMSALSLTAACGVLVTVFQDGHLRTLLGGFTPTGTLNSTIPLLMFCVAFALCVDYEVFLISRIREEYLATGDNTRAVVLGTARTGRLISAAACAFAIPVAALATSGVVLLKQLGVGLAVAVLVDATAVRGILVPAFMQLAGPANWWTPHLIRRRVTPRPQACANRLNPPVITVAARPHGSTVHAQPGEDPALRREAMCAEVDGPAVRRQV